MGSTVKEEQSSKMFAPLNTGDNMQIVFSEEVWVTKLTAGDEILSYDSSHNLIGATRFLNPLTVLTVWGDDETTIIKDGLSFNEQISFEIWSKENQKPIKIDTWLQGEFSVPKQWN